MSYRPICDVWQLARPKLGGHSYYGAYPSGFLERACYLLGVNPWSRVLHVCGGALRHYHSGPTKGLGLGVYHKTIDLDPETDPDFLMDVRRLGVRPTDLFPLYDGDGCRVWEVESGSPVNLLDLWDAALIDRPYSPQDHEHYDVPADVFPSSLNDLLKRALSCVRPGGCVGVLDYLWPMPPAKQRHLPRPGNASLWMPDGDEADKPATRLIATIQVLMGWNNRSRIYSVYQRLPTRKEASHLDEHAANIYADTFELSEVSDRLEETKKELAEVKEELEGRYTQAEVDELVAEAEEREAEGIIRWALEAGADPAEAPVSARDQAMQVTARIPGYAFPRPYEPMTVADKQAIVEASGRILRSAGMVLPTEQAARLLPAPSNQEAEEGYQEVFRALTEGAVHVSPSDPASGALPTPLEGPDRMRPPSSPPTDAALEGFA